MSPKSIGPFAQAWYKWKALRLPWRKRFLVGFDLQGNTYWEFRLTTRGAGDPTSTSNHKSDDERWRRIVKYPRSTHYSEIRVSPAWHSWLRHSRADPPPLEEQAAEVARQARMRRLAAEADRRWEAKPRVMDVPAAAGEAIAAPTTATSTRTPASSNSTTATATATAKTTTTMTKAAEEGGVAQSAGKQLPDTETSTSTNPNPKSTTKMKPEQGKKEANPDPWEKARRRAGAGEDWQPTAWNPGTTRNRS